MGGGASGCGGASAPQRVNGGGAGQAGSCRRRGMPGAVVNAVAAPIRHGGPALLPGGSAAGLGAPGPPVLSCRAEAARVRWAWPVQLQERRLYPPLREDRPCGAGAAQPGHPPQAPAVWPPSMRWSNVAELQVDLRLHHHPEPDCTCSHLELTTCPN